MSDDLPARLRKPSFESGAITGLRPLLDEAANRIEALERERDEALFALRSETQQYELQREHTAAAEAARDAANLLAGQLRDDLTLAIREQSTTVGSVARAA